MSSPTSPSQFEKKQVFAYRRNEGVLIKKYFLFERYTYLKEGACTKE